MSDNEDRNWRRDLERVRTLVAVSPEAQRRGAMSEAELDELVIELYAPYYDAYVAKRLDRPFPNIRDIAIIAAAAVVLFLFRIPIVALVMIVLLVPAFFYKWASRVTGARERRRKIDKQQLERRVPGIFTVLPE